MAYIYRLIIILFIALPGFVSAQNKCYQYVASYAGAVFKGSSASNVCSALAAHFRTMAEGWGVSTYITGGGPNYTCNLVATSPNGASKSNYDFTIYGTEVPCNDQCVAPLIKDASGKCSCPAGSIEGKDANGITQCVNTDKTECWNFSQTATLPGGDFTTSYRYSGKHDDKKMCLPVSGMSSPAVGCTVQFTMDARYDYGGGHWVTDGHLSMDPDSNLVDQSCSLEANKEPPKPPEKEKCPNGYTGAVNGVEVCVNKVPDSGVGTNTGTTTTNDGTNTTTTQTDSSTNCKSGVCTTTTTTTTTITNNSTGSSTTSTNTGTSTENQEGFCKKNPANKVCGGGNGDDKPSSFTGSCSAGFQCDGDAIQCSIAREQHKRSCKLFDDKSPESELYEKEKGKEGNQTKDLPGNETISIQGKIDTSDAIGGGAAGVQDLNIVVWGRSITLPFSQVNSVLDALGRVLLAVSFLMAIRIVSRG